ncbi:MAG TPA: hypothetical protein VFF66_02970 [Brevundimonas sp.]|nr:hypothetical protein [Brevundimonas sp.]
MSGHFDSKLIPKCHDRLKKAKRSLQLCRGARNFEEFESYWSEFLIHAGGVLNALDTGSKITPQGRQWYGDIKRAGRNDPLVSYMHQARNIEEHDAQSVSEHNPGGVGIGGSGEDVYISNLVIGPEFFRNPALAIKGKAWNQHGRTPSVSVTPAGPVLRPVTYRDVVFTPPTEHRGRPLADTRPLAIGAAYIGYLEGLVRVAEEIS